MVFRSLMLMTVSAMLISVRLAKGRFDWDRPRDNERRETVLRPRGISERFIGSGDEEVEGLADLARVDGSSPR